MQYLEITSNMVAPEDKSRKGKLIHSFNSSDSECSPSLKGVFNESQGIFMIPKSAKVMQYQWSIDVSRCNF